MTPETITELFTRFRSQNPYPQTELVYINTYGLLVAVILSAQATDVSVNKATKNLFQIADTPQKMLELGLEELIGHIKTIGLYRAKSRNIVKMSQILVEKFNGQVPANRQDLESLPGVGRKTASVMLNVAFDEPSIAVDTHIFRVANRLKLAPGKNAIEVEKKLENIVPIEFRMKAHHWLLLHGRYICKARIPLCPDCIVKDLCPFEPKTEKY
jgi:endonuclease-3